MRKSNIIEASSRWRRATWEAGEAAAVAVAVAVAAVATAAVADDDDNDDDDEMKEEDEDDEEEEERATRGVEEVEALESTSTMSASDEVGVTSDDERGCDTRARRTRGPAWIGGCCELGGG